MTLRYHNTYPVLSMLKTLSKNLDQQELKHSIKTHPSKVSLGLKFLRFAVITFLLFGLLHFLRDSGMAFLPSTENLRLLYRCICIIYLLELTRRYFNNLYIFGKQRLLRISGIISFRFQKRSVAYPDIREVSLKQSIIGRVFNYGTLEFGTAASDDFDISFEDVGDPYRLSQYAQEIITATRKARDGEHGEHHRPDD